MFDVLMYLFETYIHSDADVMVEQDELTDELSRAGFNQEEIEKTLNWLERLANLHDSEREVYVTASAQGSMRIYAPQELARLSTQGEIVNILLKIKNSFLPTKQILIGL